MKGSVERGACGVVVEPLARQQAMGASQPAGGVVANERARPHEELKQPNPEGEEDDVKDFLSWAHAGPSTARADDVEARWRSYTGEYTDFRITR